MLTCAPLTDFVLLVCCSSTSVASGIYRKAAKDFELDAYQIGKDSTIMIPIAYLPKPPRPSLGGSCR